MPCQPTAVSATKIQLNQSPTFSEAGLPPSATLASEYEGLKRAERVAPAVWRETGTYRRPARFLGQHHPDDASGAQRGGVRLELDSAAPSVVACMFGRHLQNGCVASRDFGEERPQTVGHLTAVHCVVARRLHEHVGGVFRLGCDAVRPSRGVHLAI